MTNRRHRVSFNPLAIIHDINRFLEILSVLVRHGFGHIVAEITRDQIGIRRRLKLSSKVASEHPVEPVTIYKRVRLVLQDLGPTFIKLGQILGTRPDLIPFEMTLELEGLQDEVPPISFDEAKNLIESELGDSIGKLYKSFDKTPIATASIGQVYGATLESGEDVVVKIRRPRIEPTIKRDIELLYYLAQILEKRVVQLRLFDPVGIVFEFERAILKELDYGIERRSILKFSDAFKDSKEIVIPKVYRQLSSKSVLTMQRIRGVKITNCEQVGSSGKELARVALRAVLVMVFENGFFHADPHPGNIFALPGNKIAFLDMGMVGRLDDRMRFTMADLIIAVMEHDVETVANIIYALGTREKKVSRSHFNRDIGDILDKVTGIPLDEINFSEIVKDLFNCARRFSIRVPNEFTLMGKALMTVEGIAKNLDPGFNMEYELEPFVRKLIAIRYSPKRIAKALFRRARQVYHWSNDLPEHFMTVLEDLHGGNLKLQIEQPDQDHMLQNIDRIAVKVIFGLISCSLIISSTVFMTFSSFEYGFIGVPIALWAGLAGYLAAALIGLHTWRSSVKVIDRDYRP